jgi:transposase InsO family protein
LIEFFNGYIKPKTIVTDNGKEFCSFAVEEYLSKEGIEHYKTGVEAHKCNGRVERVIRSILEAICKDNKVILRSCWMKYKINTIIVIM